MKKLIRWSLVVAASLELLYVAATTIILNSYKVFDAILAQNPKELQLHINHGWSFIPGLVEIRDVSVRGADQNVQWVILIAKARLHINLLELTHLKVHVPKLVGSEIGFNIRLKSEEEKKQWPRSEKFTAVEERKKGTFQLQFDDIVLSRVENLQIGPLKFEGKGQIQGGFFLWPSIEVAVGPAHLNIQEGKIFDEKSQGKRFPLMEDIVGNFETRINPFHPDEIKGSQVFEYLNQYAKVEGNIRNFRVINQYLKNIPQIHVDGGSGHLTALVSVLSGKLQPKSEFALTSPQIRINGYKMMASGNGAISGKVFQEDGFPTSEVKVLLNKFNLISLEKKYEMMKGRGFEVLAKSSDLDLLNPFSAVALTLKLPNTEIPDLRRWSRLLDLPSENMRLTHGQGRVNALLYAVSDSRGKNPDLKKVATNRDGFLHFAFPKVQGNWQSAGFSGDLDGNLVVSELNLHESTGSISMGRFNLNHVNWDFTDVKDKSKKLVLKEWWLNGEVSSVSSKFGKSPEFNGDVKINFKDTVPILNLYKQAGKLSWLEYYILNMDLPKISTSFSSKPKKIALTNLKLNSKSLDAVGNLSFLPTGTWGNIKVSFGIIRAGIEMDGKETHFKLFP